MPKKIKKSKLRRKQHVLLRALADVRKNLKNYQFLGPPLEKELAEVTRKLES